MGKFLGLAVGEAHESGLARGIGDRALRAGGYAGDPLPAGAGEFAYLAAGLDGKHLAVLPAGDQPVIGRVVKSG